MLWVSWAGALSQMSLLVACYQQAFARSYLKKQISHRCSMSARVKIGAIGEPTRSYCGQSSASTTDYSEYLVSWQAPSLMS